MENINNFSRQRGRVIEFRELLYGYTRTNTLFGQDLILDLLLVYKKYRGKKMTVPVRRHLYIQRSFTEIRIKEISQGHQAGSTVGTTYVKTNDHFLSKHQTMGIQFMSQNHINDGKLNEHDVVYKKGISFCFLHLGHFYRKKLFLRKF
jgi:hypothetical protein